MARPSTYHCRDQGNIIELCSLLLAANLFFALVQERADMHLALGAGCLPRGARQLQRERYPGRVVLKARTFLVVDQHLRGMGAFGSTNHERDRQVQDGLEDVFSRFNDSPSPERELQHKSSMAARALFGR
ncbi:hypothetical protein J6590_022418 [Homalodisca vitripennis]|nr:hypothetical protein J6590_022418 [Homalodisca vitripennis]